MSYLRPRNFLLVSAVVLVAILLAVIASRYRPAGTLEKIAKALPEGVDVSLQDIDYTHTEDGRARWRLVARQVERKAQTSTLEISSPRMSFFDDNGATSGTLQAARGEVSEDYRRVQLQGDVVLTNTAGYTLYTDQLSYDSETETASSAAHVRLESERLHLEGRGMEARLRAKQLVLKEQVQGVLTPEENP